MDKESASGAVDSDLVQSSVKPLTVQLIFIASLLDVQQQRDSVKNQLASLLVVPLGKALIRIKVLIFS